MPDYKVTVAGSDPIPVRAANVAAARNHAVRKKVTVEQLTTDDAIAFGKKNVDLQIAGDTEEPAAAESDGGEGDKGEGGEKE